MSEIRNKILNLITKMKKASSEETLPTTLQQPKDFFSDLISYKTSICPISQRQKGQIYACLSKECKEFTHNKEHYKKVLAKVIIWEPLELTTKIYFLKSSNS
jgi:hypothetical protein